MPIRIALHKKKAIYMLKKNEAVNFNGFEIRSAEPCDCDGVIRDDVEHFLLRCPKYDAQRVALLDKRADLGWPETARSLVSTESFEVFANFCSECLWLREEEQKELV